MMHLKTYLIISFGVLSPQGVFSLAFFSSSKSNSQSQVRSSTKIGHKTKPSNHDQFCKSKVANLCPDPEDDPDMDRREATFAMLGGLWAAGAIPAAILPAALSHPQPANAEYGTDAKIMLPNPMEQMSDRQNKQCLMESLGNRECLVWEDPDNKLYQNPDVQLLVERVEKAGVALSTLPELIESKNWMKVNGLLTGPMGTLANTMDLLSKASGNPSACADKAKRVKNDLYAIQGASDRRNVNLALEAHKEATDHLVDFLKTL